MTKFPFQLSIKNTSSDKQTESLTCRALLRTVPGRRRVYDALWNNKEVIAKVFSHKVSAKRHLRREWQGLNKLVNLQLNSPEPLFYGKAENGQWALVAEKIIDSSTVLEAIGKITDKAERLDLLIRVCRELAKQHNCGVLQKDLHLGNFLLADDNIFALDPGQMQFFAQPITRKKSISQLALLACYLPTDDTASTKMLCEQYACERNWRFEKADEAIFQKQLTKHKRKGIRKGLKKTLRTSKRSLRVKAGEYLAVFDRDFCKSDKAADFIEQIDTLMDTGRILKNGNTCYVCRVRFNGKDIAVKRYNHKGFIHSLRHTVKGSRARQGWLHAHRLGMLGIDTPRPLAFIEQRKAPLLWKSYLVTEYMRGQNLHSLLQNSSATEQQQSKIIQQIRKLLNKLGKHRITHGDLKHSNILIAEGKPVLTDLDAMKFHRWNWFYSIRRAKDLERFAEKESFRICNRS